MTRKVEKGHTYRHTPAFILLLLAKKELYGAALLSTLREELPSYHTDSAVIYRSLQELEDSGAVKAYWETDTAGPARKWYAITAKGIDMLHDHKQDIAMRKKNLDYFLDSYAGLFPDS